VAPSRISIETPQEFVLQILAAEEKKMMISRYVAGTSPSISISISTSSTITTSSGDGDVGGGVCRRATGRV
jgi:hypothetical protein